MLGNLIYFLLKKDLDAISNLYISEKLRLCFFSEKACIYFCLVHDPNDIFLLTPLQSLG